MNKLLVANRGEIAVRIFQTASDLGYQTVAVYPEDDAHSLHVTIADEAVMLPGTGAAAYLDIEQVVAAAKQSGATMIHPGMASSANLQHSPQLRDSRPHALSSPLRQLQTLATKPAARPALETGVPLLPGTNEDTSLEAALAFWDEHPDQGMMIKAISGGGGRGMRIIEAREDIEKQYERCRSEANMAFGNDAVYVELLVRRARHIEVQVIGDGTGKVIHLWERDCSAQRQNQKVIEIAPSPNLPELTRAALLAASVDLAASASYRGLGTFEFLVDADDPEKFYFIEANARLQVEHTVTEVITGLDLVAAQIAVAEGKTLADLDLTKPVPESGLPSRPASIWKHPARKAASSQPAAPLPSLNHRPGLASAPTPSAMPVIAPQPATIHCWPN